MVIFYTNLDTAVGNAFVAVNDGTPGSLELMVAASGRQRPGPARVRLGLFFLKNIKIDRDELIIAVIETLYI